MFGLYLVCNRSIGSVYEVFKTRHVSLNSWGHFEAISKTNSEEVCKCPQDGLQEGGCGCTFGYLLGP